jgi:hypothetical protein
MASTRFSPVNAFDRESTTSPSAPEIVATIAIRIGFGLGIRQSVEGN